MSGKRKGSGGGAGVIVGDVIERERIQHSREGC